MEPSQILQLLEQAVSHQRAGRLPEAIAAYRSAIALSPNPLAPAQYNLGNALVRMGLLAKAIGAYQQAIIAKPDYAEAYANLGVALLEMGRPDDAVKCLGRAIDLSPSTPEVHYNLGNALRAKDQLDPAIAAYRQAIALKPSLFESHANLANALKDNGQLDEAVAAHRRAMALRPANAGVHSNLILSMYYHPHYDAPLIAAEQSTWNLRHAEPRAKFIVAHANDRDPERRLRVGYLSPDFREHSQSFFTVPLLAAHDHRQVEVFCYADIRRADGVTQQLQAHAEHWREIAGKSDEQVCGLIGEDRIDILVDLTMHMDRNRLGIFAHKPAPVQACWLAYPGSTGVRTIDYRLSDPYLDPPGMDESVYSERTIRLPDSFWCYDPLDGRDVPVNALPAHENGAVTFGCLNNFCKINDDVLKLWARVLQAVANSRLLLLAPHGSARHRTIDQLQKAGVDADRIEFVSRQPRPEYLQTYHRIDIGLDTFPYNGHTTSLDALWMGVPVITLVGKQAVGRAGWCQLSNLGLTELAAQTPEQFVGIATELAENFPRLAELRSQLRARMLRSPLMNGPRFARNMESAYREMWRTWCAR